MQELTLKELQQVSLGILKDVHNYCVRNNIRYSIAYGTLIGAVRHKGFIPWDDDVDIVLPRPDFERFCNDYQSDKYDLIYYGNDKTAIATFARVCDNKRTLYQTERPWTKQTSGVWIDIFPLDGLPNNQEEYNTLYRHLTYTSKLAYKLRRQNHHITKGDPLWSKIKTYIAKIIGLNGFVAHSLIKKMVKEMSIYNYDQSNYWGQMSCLDDGPIMFRKEDFSSTIFLPFENVQLCAMNGYDRVLRQLYGDYMQLPPEDKRTPKQYWIKFLRKKLTISI